MDVDNLTRVTAARVSSYLQDRMNDEDLPTTGRISERENAEMTVPARIHIVTLGVADLRRSVRFYSALGWERCKSSNEEIAWFRTGGAYLGLFPQSELMKDAQVSGGTDAGPRSTLAVNVAHEIEVTRALEDAVRAGATLQKAAEKADWGGFSGYFADPDGHLWEVAFNPFFPINPDGSITIP